ncbi:MAG: hypothetical protein HQL08_09930 [Nitrospirae bacterium]|nr:hypothetical protein [Nitrospirota bacterium]
MSTKIFGIKTKLNKLGTVAGIVLPVVVWLLGKFWDRDTKYTGLFRDKV